LTAVVVENVIKMYKSHVNMQTVYWAQNSTVW